MSNDFEIAEWVSSNPAILDLTNKIHQAKKSLIANTCEPSSITATASGVSLTSVQPATELQGSNSVGYFICFLFNLY
jgi:hypothetical protein